MPGREDFAVGMAHGAYVEKKCCSHEECTNDAQSEGLCFRHGANVKKAAATWGAATWGAHVLPKREEFVLSMART